MFLTLSQVALGGAAGSVLRYLLVAQVRAPMGTLAVNVIGSFVMGVLAVMLIRWQPPPGLRRRSAQSRPWLSPGRRLQCQYVAGKSGSD